MSVTSVQPLDDFKVIITFDNNEQRLLDIRPYMDLAYFEDLKDKKLFNTVHPCFECIEWANEASIDAGFIMDESTPYNNAQ